jgi:hypothetical protein
LGVEATSLPQASGAIIEALATPAINDNQTDPLLRDRPVRGVVVRNE